MAKESRWLAVAAALMVGLFGVAVASARSNQVTPVPTPAPGFTDVRVLGEPTVQAVQSGEWVVDIRNATPVELAPGTVTNLGTPGFLRPGVRYHITWGNGFSGTWTLTDVQRDGWVRVERGTETRGQSWINVAQAASIEQVGDE
jgi:hypothetical protein